MNYIQLSQGQHPFDAGSWVQATINLSFRQWRHEGHCRFVHTYTPTITVGLAPQQDQRKMDSVLALLYNLKGAMLVAASDPEIQHVMQLGAYATQCLLLPEVGCERTAEWIYRKIIQRCKVVPRFVEVREHESNAGGVFRQAHEDQNHYSYFSSKTYPATRGFTTNWVNSDWQLEGGSLEVALVFASRTLDDNNWVVPFGDLKPLKARLDEQYDHTTLVAMMDRDANALIANPSLNVRAIDTSRVAHRDASPWVGIEAIIADINHTTVCWAREHVERVGNGAYVHSIGARLSHNDWTYGVNDMGVEDEAQIEEDI